MEILKTLTAEYPVLKELIFLTGILLVAYAAYFLTHKILFRLISKLLTKSKLRYKDLLLQSKVLPRLSFIIPLLIVDGFSVFIPEFQVFVRQAAHVLLILVFIRALAAFLGSVNSYYEMMPRAKERPIKGYIQVAVIVNYVVGIIFVIGAITGQSLWVLLSGIGAMTAVILLIFKDTILSFVAGIQITGYDLIHVGDWIAMPEYGADGDVIDIALHTVKVQNWDKTITVIPTHKLTENAFKNWRGMQQAGGRRIMRAISIDQNSITACTDEMIERFAKIKIISDYVHQKKEELEKHNRENEIDESVKVNRRQMTNIGTFRMYAQAYLENHPRINHSLTTMVRQLPPGPNGLPLEIYAFTNTTEWLAYESIQGDIFDHLLSVIPEFDLDIFQNPAGADFRQLANPKK